MLKVLVIYVSFCLAHTIFNNVIVNLNFNKAIQERSLFKEMFPTSLVQCAKLCLSRPSACLSFNYRPTMRLCQLSASNDTSLVEHSPATLHSLMSTWPRKFIGKCSNMNCPKGRYCDETDTLCKISECDVIPQFPGMKVRNFDRSIGISVEYVCSKERFVPVGNMAIVCQSNGTWNTLEGKCVLGYCENPPDVDNSVVKFGSNKIGTVREYICKKFHFIKGKPTITCQKNGNWTTINFMCHVRCPISKRFRYRIKEDICYKIKYQAKSHDEAEKECWRENSAMITIRSRKMQNILNAEISSYLGNSSTYSYHIDGRYEMASNVWKAKNGRELNFTNGNRHSSSTAMCLDKSCAIVVNSTWICAPCSTLALPVCEYGKCPQSYRMYPNLNLCYKKHDSDRVNRTEAKHECQKNDGHLLVIDSQEIQDYITSMNKNKETLIAAQSERPFSYTLLTNYGYSVGTSTSITLQFKACSNIHMGLMSENNKYSTIMYEIVIGGWGGTRSGIRMEKEGKQVVTVHGNELNCTEFKEFTFSWKSGKIEVLRGDGTQVMSYQDPKPRKVNFIGITGGIWADITFKFEKEGFYWISGWYRNGAWVDDNNRKMNYFNWNSGEPDEKLGSSGISLRKITGSGTERWFDDEPSEKHFFICEYPWH